MDNYYNVSYYNSVDDEYSPERNCNDSILDALVGFEKLRITALTNAAEISPLIKEVTIGPNSPLKKSELIQQSPTKVVPCEENLVEDKLSEDLRYTLIMREHQAQLQKTSEVLYISLIEKMLAKRAETMTNYFKKQSEECQRRAVEVRARKLELLKELRENDNMSVLEKAKIDEEKSKANINRQTIDNMNRILEEQNKATARFASITDSDAKIYMCYNAITSILNTEPLAKKVCDKYLTSINSVIGNISVINDMCNDNSVTDKEVKQAEVLVVNIENIKEKIIEDLNKLKQQELIKEQEENELKKKLEVDQKKAKELEVAKIIEIEKLAKEQINKTKQFYSMKNYDYYKELSKFLDQYEEQYRTLLDDVKLKKFRFDCQKAVNTPINALSSVSGTHIRDKYDKLSKLLRGERVQVLDIFVSATQHPQGLSYCTALLAKKIVRQGELLVSSNPEAAFPLAAVTVALWSQFPLFGRLLEAYFHRQCPYLVPMLLPQQEGQTDKEFYMSRGYTYNEEGVVEKQDKFLKRMSGIFTLRCAIWTAITPAFLNTTNPHNLQFGWQWLASFVNLKPEPDISATLIHDFLTVCGQACIKYYKKQFIKMIRLISTQYLAILQNIDEGGPKTRLEVFLQNVLKTGTIEPPIGVLKLNTW